MPASPRLYTTLSRWLNRHLRKMGFLCQALCLTAWLVVCLVGSTRRYFAPPKTAAPKPGKPKE
jgi:hypothetical protein